jgi:PAS domain S-box-containing protein
MVASKSECPPVGAGVSRGGEAATASEHGSGPGEEPAILSERTRRQHADDRPDDLLVLAEDDVLALSDVGAVSPEEAAPEAGAFRTFWELSTDLLSIAEADGTLLHVNPAWTRVLGWSRRELLTGSALDLLHPDDLEPTLAVLARLHDSGHVVEDFENRFRTRAGDYRVLRWNTRAGMDGRVYSVTRDVTEARENEHRLRESEERFRLSMTHAAIGMALVGLGGEFVEVNDALCRILGRPRDVLTTLTFQDLTHPDDLETDLEYVQALASGELDHYDMEKRYYHADGSIVWATLAGSVLRDEDGAPRYYIAQIQDITPRKVAEAELRGTLERLRQANATLTDFAAIAAHDLKSPLAVSVSMLDLITMRFGGDLPEQARELFERVEDQLRRLAHQVDGLLRLAAVTSRTLDLQTLDVPSETEGVVDGLGYTLAGVELRIDPCPAVLADNSALAVVLQNLLENGARHGASRLHLHAEPVEGGRVRVYVDDDGPGVPPAEREHAFEPFFQGPGGAGTGLGLATCRYVIERHGGEIGIGDAPEGGARLWFTLPAG